MALQYAQRFEAAHTNEEYRAKVMAALVTHAWYMRGEPANPPTPSETRFGAAVIANASNFAFQVGFSLLLRPGVNGWITNLSDITAITDQQISDEIPSLFTAFAGIHYPDAA